MTLHLNRYQGLSETFWGLWCTNKVYHDRYKAISSYWLPKTVFFFQYTWNPFIWSLAASYMTQVPFFWIRTPSGFHQSCHRKMLQLDPASHFSNGLTVLLRFSIFFQPQLLSWGMLILQKLIFYKIRLNLSYPIWACLCKKIPCMSHYGCFVQFSPPTNPIHLLSFVILNNCCFSYSPTVATYIILFPPSRHLALWFILRNFKQKPCSVQMLILDHDLHTKLAVQCALPG